MVPWISSWICTRAAIILASTTLVHLQFQATFMMSIWDTEVLRRWDPSYKQLHHLKCFSAPSYLNLVWHWWGNTKVLYLSRTIAHHRPCWRESLNYLVDNACFIRNFYQEKPFILGLSLAEDKIKYTSLLTTQGENLRISSLHVGV